MRRPVLTAALAVALLVSPVAAQQTPRARDLGVPFEGTPGPLNAITDVAGVEVGMTTLIAGDPAQAGDAVVRTGVTAIHPRGRASADQVFAAWFSINGNGEMTGAAWIDEGGFLEGPVAITNTHSVGIVRDAIVEWSLRNDRLQQPWSLPVVAETWDGVLNDINGFHVTKEHVFAALDEARSGPVPEGNVGGGTGMICYQFKCGTGTASRRAGSYTVGVLVQANHGSRAQLRIAGVPVGAELPARPRAGGDEQGSIIVVIAIDAPLVPHQLERIARRATHGLARTGATSGNGSGDIVVAFSTANRGAAEAEETAAVTMLANRRLSALFEATAQATEEAIVNALVAAETMTGYGNRTIEALPHDELKRLLQQYGR